MERAAAVAFDASTADEAVRTQTTEARNFIEQTLAACTGRARCCRWHGCERRARTRCASCREAMLRVAGDAFYGDAVAAIDRAAALTGARARSPGRIGTTRPPRRCSTTIAFACGTAWIRDGRRADSAGSPFAPAVDAAARRDRVCHVAAPSDAETHRSDGTQAAAQSKGYAYAAARVDLVPRADCRSAQSRFGDGAGALRSRRSTRSRAWATSSRPAATHNLLAALHDYLGDEVSAWEHRLIAFEALSVVALGASSSRRCLRTAVPSLRLENPETALAVQDAALAVARESGREAAIAEILAQRASTAAQPESHRRGDARPLAKRARHLARIPRSGRSQPSRSRDARRPRASCSDARIPLPPSTAATAAIEIVQQRRDRLRLAQLNLRLAQANIVWGRTGEARVALDRRASRLR